MRYLYMRRNEMNRQSNQASSLFVLDQLDYKDYECKITIKEKYMTKVSLTLRLFELWLPLITESSYPTKPAEGSKVLPVNPVVDNEMTFLQDLCKNNDRFKTRGFSIEITPLLTQLISGWVTQTTSPN